VGAHERRSAAPGILLTFGIDIAGLAGTLVLVTVWRFLQVRARGGRRARLHCRFVLPRIHFIPDLLTYSVPLFLKRQCD
jgi:hypothetical protein